METVQPECVDLEVVMNFTWIIQDTRGIVLRFGLCTFMLAGSCNQMDHAGILVLPVEL